MAVDEDEAAVAAGYEDAAIEGEGRGRGGGASYVGLPEEGAGGRVEGEEEAVVGEGEEGSAVEEDEVAWRFEGTEGPGEGGVVEVPAVDESGVFGVADEVGDGDDVGGPGCGLDGPEDAARVGEEADDV